MVDPQTISLLLQTGRLIRGKMEHALPLPFSQCEVLRLIAEQERPRMRDIAKHFKITAPSATSLVNELVRGGYIKRVSNHNDRRQVRLSLTHRGKKTLQGIVEKRLEVLQSVFLPLTKRDRNDLNTILEKILRAHYQ